MAADRERLTPQPQSFLESRKADYLPFADWLLSKFENGDMTREAYLERLARSWAVKDTRIRNFAQENITDHLTQIPNSRAVDIIFEQLKQNRQPECIFLVDVDNTRIGNAELGHTVTNEAILQVVQTSHATRRHFFTEPIEMLVLRRGETVPTEGVMRVHTRGDEFVVFTKGLKTKKQQRKFAEFLRTSYFNTPSIQELNSKVSKPFSVSVAGAVYNPDQNPNEFLNMLSAGPLQQAKTQGKNRTVIV